MPKTSLPLAAETCASGASFASPAWRLPPRRSREEGSPPVFAHPEIFLPAWFALARSRQLRGARVVRATAGPHDLALWRDGEGIARAFPARCPHLGADLAFGRVVDGQLRCALHGWRYDGEGHCTHMPGVPPDSAGPRRRTQGFPVVEKYGLIFVYPGRAPAPPFPPMPDGDDEAAFHAVVLPDAHLRCHHHLATANGLDAVHFDGLHDLEPLAPAHYEVEEERAAVHLTLRGRYRGRLLRTLTGGQLHGRFSAIGPSVAWTTFHAQHRWHALFVTRPMPDGACASRVVLFLPKGHVLRTLRAALFLVSLGRQDGRMLEALRTFRPTFVDTDAPLASFAQALERWPRE